MKRRSVSCRYMNRIASLIFLLLVTLPAQANWQSIFNGKDLEGWSGDPRLWRVQDGVIIGESNDSDKKTAENSFLIWQGGKAGDFELEFQARVTGKNNSGVQYRSKLLDADRWKVSGYQMDLHPQASYLGMLYEERGRGIVCERGARVKLWDKPEVKGILEVPAVDLAVWNSYRIVAQGFVLRHFVNGRLAAEVHDMHPEKRSTDGVIALQLHAGPPMKAEFKDLRIRRSIVSGSGASSGAVWIWNSATPKENENVDFRREFQLPENIGSASVTIICDDSHRLFVNGEKLGGGDGWNSPFTYDVISQIKPGGRNIIAVECRNEAGNAGFALRFLAKLKDGKKLHIVSDSNWRCSSDRAEGWRNLDFDGSNWAKATVVAKMGDAPWGAVMPSEPE
ncbi:MAG: family 16 glycoside hydrolase [Luteolibacter sp.]